MDPIPDPGPLCWEARRFAELDPDALYELLRLRAEVFVVEQACAYLDPDGKDRHPQVLHLLGRDGGGTLAAYLRILPPGLSYPQVSFGRVLTAPAHRGRGHGEAMLREALAAIECHWPGADIQIGAQAHLQGYYRQAGFEPSSEPYIEDGIPHVDMLRQGTAPSLQEPR